MCKSSQGSLNNYSPIEFWAKRMNLVPVISEGREFDKHKEYLGAEIAAL